MGATFKSITKLEAAERQLAQAIRLFFGQGDEIAIHTLASTAYQILSDMCGGNVGFLARSRTLPSSRKWA